MAVGPLRATAVPTGAGSWRLLVVNQQGEPVQGVGVAFYGAEPMSPSALDAPLARIKHKRTSEWIEEPDGTLTSHVERF